MTAPHPSDDRVGVIGLGLLGSALAERLIAGGVEVLGFDIAQERRAEFTALGGESCLSALHVARNCRRLLLVLPDDRISRSVLGEAESALEPGTIILDATTGDADASAELGQALAERGIFYLDATVSGSSVQARRGEALFMVGGDRDAFERSQDLFRLLTHRAIHTGPCGSGTRTKLVTNLVLGLNRAALAEGLAFAESLGLDPEQTLDILKASVAYSRAMDAKGEKMVRRDFSVQARLSQHLKDVRLMLSAAKRSGQTLPLTETHRTLLESAEEQGLGELDNSSIFLAIECRNCREPA